MAVSSSSNDASCAPLASRNLRAACRAASNESVAINSTRKNDNRSLPSTKSRTHVSARSLMAPPFLCCGLRSCCPQEAFDAPLWPAGSLPPFGAATQRSGTYRAKLSTAGSLRLPARVLPLIWCLPHRDQLHLDARVNPCRSRRSDHSFRRRYWEEDLLLYTTCLNDCGLFLIERYQLRAVDLEESSSRESRRIKRIGGDQQHLEELQLRPTFHQQANASRRPLAHRVPL